MDLTCWTGTLETQPRVERDSAGQMTARLIIGCWTPNQDDKLDITVEAAVFGHDEWQKVDTGRLKPLTSGGLEARANAAVDDVARLDAECWVQDILAAINADGANRYYEVEIRELPVGSLMQFKAIVCNPERDLTYESQTRGLWLVAPTFGHEDVRASHTPDGLPPNQWWVLMQRAEGGFQHVRVDLLASTAPNDRTALPPISIKLGDGPTVRLTSRSNRVWEAVPGPGDLWPVLDRVTDSVLLSVPSDDDRVLPVTIRTGVRSKPVDPESTQPQTVDTVVVDGSDSDAQQYGATGLMILQYAIQGFNDLFQRPVEAYQPPRNYIEIAFSDEKGRYCSRPERVEDGVPDGYVFALQAQAAYQVKTQWAMNVGLLTLLKHGLPADQFELITEQVASGMISVSNAGFGAHRPPYYREETNLKELRLGEQAITNILGDDAYDRTYYPDQRIYEAKPEELACYRTLRAAGELGYLVLDRSAVTTTIHAGSATGQVSLFGDNTVLSEDGNYLWTDSGTGLTLLLIEDRFRNLLMQANDDEIARGQLQHDLRALFMKAVAAPVDQPRKIYVYGDDLDHSCGDGWFDGSEGPGLFIYYTRSYCAAMRWISTHPWVRAVTAKDLDADPKLAARYRQSEPIDVTGAICPSVDPGGPQYVDAAGNANHFDTWEQWWAGYPAVWLNRTLGQLSDRLERALVGWRKEYRNGLYELAWMYFLAYTHESMWSKQPIGPGINGDPVRWEPEDFVISESLQQRNAWVYLNASVWASPDLAAALAAADDGVGVTYVLADGVDDAATAGPLQPMLQQTRSATKYWKPGERATCYWDQDVLSTIVLYNKDVLAVIDRNGGRVTHLFARSGQRAISVSGTLKAQQFLSFVANDNDDDDQIPCDGARLQNTVRTPNHAYIAADVRESAPVLGTFVDPRNPDVQQPTWYPDNFDEYTCAVHTGADTPAVVCTYQPGTDDLPPTDADQFTTLCESDGADRRQGKPGHVTHPVTVNPQFTKTFRLEGAQLRVSYRNVPAGHVVTNEFCVDLERAVMEGTEQTKTVADDEIALRRDGFTVTVTTGENCRFFPAARLTKMPRGKGDAAMAQQQDYGELHRVLTDDLRIECPDGGDFEYILNMGVT